MQKPNKNSNSSTDSLNNDVHEHVQSPPNSLSYAGVNVHVDVHSRLSTGDNKN